MNPDTQSPPPYFANVERQRQDFYRDIARMPVTAVEGMVDSVSFLSPAERQRILNRRDELAQQREQQVAAALDREWNSFSQRAERAHAEAEQVAGDLEELIADTEAGRVDLPDFRRRYEELERRLSNVQRASGSFTSSVDSIRQKEEEPEVWLQGLEKRFPAIREGLFGAGIGHPAGDPQATDWTRREDG